MSNIHLKVIIEKKWCRYSKLQFSKFKNFASRSVFGKLQFTQVLHNFQASCCNSKIRGLGTKLCVTFLPIILILKRIMELGPTINNFRQTWQILNINSTFPMPHSPPLPRSKWTISEKMCLIDKLYLTFLKVLLINIYKLKPPVISFLIASHERLYELLQFFELHSTLSEKRFSSQVFTF